MRYELEGKVFAIIAGHAGKSARPDPGAVDGPNPAEGDTLATYEVEHTVALAERVASMLRELGAVAPVFTGDVGATCRAVNVLTGHVSAVLSLHLNAATPAALGFETWYRPGSVKGEQLATRFALELGAFPYSWALEGYTYKSRGAKPCTTADRPWSFVSGVTVAPAVLLELAFLSNVDDERRVNSSLFRVHVASSIARGLAAVPL